jgi:thiosulfate/3-mercaptopyruvate sulfurtransferase
MSLLLFAVSAVLTLIPFTPRAQNTTDPGMVVSLSWLRSHLDDKSVVVITTGSRAVYDRGHIPGARFIAHDDTIRMTGGAHYLLDPAALAPALSKAGARDDARIVLYGDSAMSTGWLYMTLASIGHGAQVSMLDGNMDAWSVAGHPASTDVPAAATGRLTPAAAPGIVVDAPWVKAHLDDNMTRVIDSRTQREWDAGHLPKATLVLWQDLFSDLKLLTFKPKDQVRALFKQAGVGDNSQVVTYCAIGMRASLMYFAARYAGIPAQVYVGSFEDWQRQSGYPVVKGPV